MSRELNRQQQEAVAHDGHLLIVAGPGSGKTTVLIERAARILRASKSRIAMVTFTRDAATEMRSRLAAHASAQLKRCLIGTFHKLTMDHQRRAGLLGRVMSGPAQAALISRCGRAAGLSYEEAAAEIEAWATHAELPEAASAVVTEYRNRKAAAREIDLWDVLHAGVSLMESGKLPALPITHLMVDEFHDTDTVQYAWVMAHVKAGAQLTVVADDDQSIYKWRHGLGVEGMRRILRDTGAHTITLGVNYRCASDIVRSARRLIEHNTDRMPKDLVSSRAEPGQIVCIRPASRNDELAVLIDWLQPSLQSAAAPRPGYTAVQGEVAVIARTGSILDEIALELRAAGVRYVRNERERMARSVMALLNLLRAVHDDNAHAFGNVLSQMSVPEDLIDGLVQAASHGDGVFTLSAAQVNKAGETAQRLHARASALRRQLALGRVELVVAGAAELIEHTEELTGRSEHQRRMLDLAVKALTRAEGGSLMDRIERLERPPPETDDAASDGVGLYTMHGSKGLEFNRVFVASVLDRIIPSARAADTAEERRLMYVAMTRAKHELAISVPRGEARPSPFVAEAGINLSVDAQGNSHA